MYSNLILLEVASRCTKQGKIIPNSIGNVNSFLSICCSKVIMSGVNGNVIMSGCGDDNPDDERREAARDYTKSVSRGADDGRGGLGSTLRRIWQMHRPKHRR